MIIDTLYNHGENCSKVFPLCFHIFSRITFIPLFESDTHEVVLRRWLFPRESWFKHIIYRLIKILYRPSMHVIRYVSDSQIMHENNFVTLSDAKYNGRRLKNWYRKNGQLLSVDGKKKYFTAMKRTLQGWTSAMLPKSRWTFTKSDRFQLPASADTVATRNLQFHWERRCIFFSSLMPAIRYYEVRGRYRVTACVTVRNRARSLVHWLQSTRKYRESRSVLQLPSVRTSVAFAIWSDPRAFVYNRFTG